MARIVLSLPIRRTADNVLTANTSPRLEVFRTATYATASGSSSTALAVAERGGHSIGDDVYVGTNAAVAISNVTSTGAGVVTLASALSWSNNDAVVVKRKTGASTDAYATIYDDPDFATAITQTSQAFVADANNVWTFFAKPGRYGVRYSNSSNTTLRLDTEVDWGVTTSVYATPSHDSPTAGIQEALNKLSSAGGTVELGPGTFTLPAATSARILPNDNTRIVGSGIGATIIKLPDSNVQYNNGVIDVTNKTNIEIAHLTIDGNVANNSTDTNPSLIFGAGATNVWIHHCELKNAIASAIGFASNTGQTNTRIFVADNYITNSALQGIYIQRGLGCVISRNVVISTAHHGISMFDGTNAVTDICKKCIISDNYVDRTTAPTVINSGLGGVQAGFLIGYPFCGEDITITGNVLVGNTAGGDDGIGWGRVASSTDGARLVISNNIVSTTGGFGIDVGANGTCVGNYVHKAGTHGIALAADALTPATDYVYGSVVIANNIIEDCDDTNTGGIYGIIIGDSSNSNRTIESLVITGNSVRDSRARMTYALSLQADASSTITNCLIADNDFSQATTAAIKWWQQGGAAMTAGITKLRVRNNLTVDAYTGGATLVAGVASVRTATSLHWPELTTILFGVHRTSIGATGANPIGPLVCLWTSATRNATVTAHTTASASTAVATDVSTVWWEFLGTAA